MIILENPWILRISGQPVARQISFTVTDETAAYLRWLRTVIPERTEDLVARHLLMRQVEEMRRKYGPTEPNSLSEIPSAESPTEETDQDRD